MTSHQSFHCGLQCSSWHVNRVCTLGKPLKAAIYRERIKLYIWKIYKYNIRMNNDVKLSTLVVWVQKSMVVNLWYQQCKSFHQFKMTANVDFATTSLSQILHMVIYFTNHEECLHSKSGDANICHSTVLNVSLHINNGEVLKQCEDLNTSHR